MDARKDAHQAERMAFGGYDKGAAFFGWLVATAVSSLLTALLGAAGLATALNRNLAATDQLRTTGLLGALLLLLALAVAYYAGGYVSGRMARFDGGRQGFGVWAISIAVIVLLAVLGALLGSSFNLLSQLQLPSLPLDKDTLSVSGIVTLVLALAVSLLAAISGAKLGERYHRKIDNFRENFRRPTENRAEPVSRPSRTQPSFGERIERGDEGSHNAERDRIDR